MERDVLSVRDAARFLGVSLPLMYEACRTGQVPHQRLGRRILFSRAALLAWLARTNTGNLPQSNLDQGQGATSGRTREVVG